ncbi:NAD(P)H-hydrate dehydratase [Xenophilus arseniciresistens]|uniref:Bifunctional NAD(P)H-hydrate repair enzyme n=1 Tax=Xenophilus arseniciresistens TaxID=1283306 RepID=A0AAE3N984_9BURK|nr:NAD(P)H-hydrate dehydratase [Xenophilus arseniciresistens]MDA7417481.1 NAD(P)H-hydrate dehydratase [Xenophilus arseniciresistens]
MQRISTHTRAPLWGKAGTRRIEAQASASLPPHTLMRRAGLGIARLAMALAPHARHIWVACGPGNNGGDGFEAAVQLQACGFHTTVSWRGDATALPSDARAALTRLHAAGLSCTPEAPSHWDLAIDALLGLGSRRPPDGHLADWLQRMHAADAPLLSVDLPSGLDADTGVGTGPVLVSRAPRHCLSLLSLKPGQFTADGRDRCGTLWLDDLGCAVDDASGSADAWLPGFAPDQPRLHATHKGSYGDVAVLGGAPGMVGAPILAATAALHAGAGRVFVGLLDPAAAAWDATAPELMFRPHHTLPQHGQALVCGCGGGEALAAMLPALLDHAGPLVLDADALNALAGQDALQKRLHQRASPAVLTPHPLEAARLLNCSTAQVQADRLAAARTLAERMNSVVLLKGSGSVIASPGAPALINPSGNARLASAGTGDVLAGFIGALLAQGLDPRSAAWRAAWRHGDLADRWPAHRPLTASALARAWPARA